MPRKTIAVYNVDEPNDIREIKGCDYEEITVCPNCHYALTPRILNGYYVNLEEKDRCTANIFMFCTRCRQVFLAKYDARAPQKSRDMIYTDKIIGAYPFKTKTKDFSPLIAGLSPMFIQTYSQSAIAYSSGLTEIAGCGYRKSIEYLIKDYLCHKDPSSSETIRDEFLGKSIQRIEDPRIRVLAERATWIGNDETHYIRKHEDLDIQDMIRFIDALLHYVESELTFEDALSIQRK